MLILKAVRLDTSTSDVIKQNNVKLTSLVDTVISLCKTGASLPDLRGYYVREPLDVKTTIKLDEVELRFLKEVSEKAGFDLDDFLRRYIRYILKSSVM